MIINFIANQINNAYLCEMIEIIIIIIIIITKILTTTLISIAILEAKISIKI